MTSLGCSGRTNAGEGLTGTLAGTTTASPSCPVEGLEECPPAPVSAIKLNVTSLADGVTTRVTSDDRGEFRTQLAPGRYRVELVAAPGVGVTTDLPATVSVIEAQETRLDIRFDSGIR
jgi:hypothetical protein